MGFEMEGFSICNTDGTEGLSFDEIMECKVCFKRSSVNLMGQMGNTEKFVIAGPFWCVSELSLAN